MPSARHRRRPPSASRSQSGDARSDLPAPGRRRRREVGAGARVRRAGRGGAARVQRRAHSRGRHDDRRQARRRRRVARRRRAHAADDGAAPRRRSCCRPRRCWCPKRESEAATRALDELEALLEKPEPQTTLVLVAGDARQAQPACTSCCAKQATLVECGVARGSGRRRAVGPDARRGGAAWRSSRPARAAARANACRHRRQAAARRRRSAAALRARAEDDHARRRARDRRAGGAAGRLGDDQRDRGGAGGRGAAAAGADARRRARRRRRFSGSSAGWCGRSFRRWRRPMLRPARRRAVSDRPGPEAVGRRAARPARAAGRGVVRAGSGADRSRSGGVGATSWPAASV